MGPSRPPQPFLFTPSPPFLTDLWESWPQLADLRSCATRAPRGWQQAVSRMVSSARVELMSSVLAQQTRLRGGPLVDEVASAAVVLGGSVRHEAIRALLGGGLRSLSDAWNWGSSRFQVALSALRGVVGEAAEFTSSALPDIGPLADTAGSSGFPHSVVMFGAALASGWPWSTALSVFAGIRLGSFCCGGRGFVTAYGLQLSSEHKLHGIWTTGSIVSRCDAGPPVTIWFDARGAVFLLSGASMRLRQPTAVVPARGSSGLVRRPGEAPVQRSRSRWLPEYIRMPLDEHGHIIIAPHLVTSIVERRHLWARDIAMDAVTRAIVFGKSVYPRSGWVTMASWKPNHKPWDNPEAKAAIGLKVGPWLLAGHLEYIPPDAPAPTIVEPQSAVPKKGPDKFRGVTDARIGNKTVDEWGVRYFSARDFGDALSPCAIAFVTDVVEGYHLPRKPGCTGELVEGWGVVGARLVYPGEPEYYDGVDSSEDDDVADPRPPRKPPEAEAAPRPPRQPVQRLEFGWRLFVGCDPRTCLRFCDKAYSGVDFDGTLCRWAVPHFGEKLAGSVLNAVALCLLRFMALRNPAPGERRGASVQTGNGVVWVDDFSFWTVVAFHALCAGLAGGCPVCLSFLVHAQRLSDYWASVCARYGVPLCKNKYQAPSQLPGYAGFDFDTVRGLALTQPEKVEKLLHCYEAWIELAQITPRELDSIQGRTLHYSYAIRYLRVIATQIFCLLGSVPEERYDQPVAVTKAMRDLAAEAHMVVQRFHGAGRPLWGRVASSLYSAFLTGPTLGGLAFALTWDASPRGWAALLRWWDLSAEPPVLRDRLLIGSWPAGEAVEDQAHRKALAAPLSFEAACQAVDLRACFGLLRNDAEAAIGALAKGSTGSPAMQRQAVRLNRAAYGVEADLLLAHVPGLALVEEGIDGASRTGDHFGSDANLAHVLGPRVGDTLWSTIQSLIAPLRWKVTVDLFATESNARAPRYFSRFGEPGAEATDALSVSDWAGSVCPHCYASHREVGYAFPPQPLIRHFLKKAVADSMLCVVVVPVAITAPYWHKLVRASVLTERPSVDGFYRVRNPHRALEDVVGSLPSELAVFACDFSRLNPRADLPSLSRCAGAFGRRPRQPCRSHGDLDDRRRLREALLSRPEGWEQQCPRPAAQ